MDTKKLNIPRSTYVETNGIRLHVMEGGYKDDPAVILLHGFPEFWYGWHDYIQPLAEANYFVLVPDQRGYNLSDKPEGIDAYRIENLVNDMLGLMDAHNLDTVRLVGHDWGAIVAWYIAMWHPERLEQLVIANVPHPYIFSEHLRQNPRQALKSWYAGAFQLPQVPERIASFNNYAVFGNLMKSISRLNEREIELYKQAWSQPGALTGMMNWYRAYIQYKTPRKTDGRIAVPTLMFWGMNDVALTNDMAQPSIDMCDVGKLVTFPDASHFVQHDEFEAILPLMEDFFRFGLAGTQPTAPAGLR